MIFRRLLFVSLLVFLILPSCAQKADSLRGVLPWAKGVEPHSMDSIMDVLSAKRDGERIIALYQLSRHYWNADPELAKGFATEAFHLSRQLKDTLSGIRSAIVLASCLRKTGDLDSATQVYEQILTNCKRGHYAREEVAALNGYALALTFQAKFDKALSCHWEGLQKAFALGDTLSVVTTYNNVGLVYYKLKDFQKALEYYLKSYRLKRAVDDRYDLDMLLINTSLCYAYLGDFVSATKYVEEGLRACDGRCSKHRWKEAGFARGIIALGRGDTLRAEEHFLESFALSQGLGDVRYQLDNIDYLSQICMARNDGLRAADYLIEAERLIQHSPSFNLERIKIYSRLASLSLKDSAFVRAVGYQIKYIELREGVFSEEMTRNLMKAEAAFMERENTARIAAQEEIIALKEEVITHQRLLNQLLVLLAVAFFALVVVLGVWYRQKKAINAVLEQKVSDRTQELQQQSDALLMRAREYELYMNRTAHEVSDTMKKIDSLCRIAKKEVSDPVAVSCLNRIVSLTDDRQREDSSGN